MDTNNLTKLYKYVSLDLDANNHIKPVAIVKDCEFYNTYLIFKKAVPENHLVKRNNYTRLLDSMTVTMQTAIKNHLRYSFEKYFKRFLMLLGLTKDEIYKVFAFEYYKGKNKIIEKYNKLYLNSVDFNNNEIALELRLKLFYIILKHFDNIQENKHNDIMNINNKSEKLSLRYKYNMEERLRHRHDLKYVYNGRGDLYKSRKRQYVSYSQYKKNNNYTNDQRASKSSRVRQTEFTYVKYNDKEDLDLLNKDEYYKINENISSLKKRFTEEADSDQENVSVDDIETEPQQQHSGVDDETEPEEHSDVDDESSQISGASSEISSEILISDEPTYVTFNNFIKIKKFSLLPNSKIGSKYIQFDLTSTCDFLSYISIKEKKNKYNFLTKAEIDLNQARKSSLLTEIERANARIKLYKTFFKADYLMNKNKLKNYNPISFYTDGDGVSVLFKKIDNEFFAKNNNSNILSNPQRMAGWDPGHKSIIFSIEQNEGEFVTTDKGVYDYYSKTLIREANYNMT